MKKTIKIMAVLIGTMMMFVSCATPNTDSTVDTTTATNNGNTNGGNNTNSGDNTNEGNTNDGNSTNTNGGNSETTVTNNNGVLNYQFDSPIKLEYFTYVALLNNNNVDIRFSPRNSVTVNPSTATKGLYRINNDFDIDVELNYNDNKIYITPYITTSTNTIISNVTLNETTLTISITRN